MENVQGKEKNIMAKADIIKFQELLNSDAEFREKLSKAAEVYTGEADERKVFDNLLLPFAQESAYLNASDRENPSICNRQ